MIATTDPRTGKVIKEFPEISEIELDKKINKAQRAFLKWKQTDFEERKSKMLKLAEILKSQKNELAELATLEMGKPLKQAVAEVEKSALGCEYYAKNAEQQLATISREIDGALYGKGEVRFDPLGIIFAVMPWNFPYWQVFRALAPNLMAGNVILLKHASNVPQCALKIEDLVNEAGFPEGIFQTLLISSSKVEQVIENDFVKGVTLTGSEFAGSKVGEASGRNIKKTVLELGGNDPFIVLADADVKSTVEAAVTARLQNNGQSCTAAKRFILMRDIANEFIEQLKAEFEKQQVGDPFLSHTDVGPLVNQAALNDIKELVDDATSKGAKVVFGGKKIEGEGYYFEPTILKGITKEMKIYSEEAFGPVASIYVVDTVEEAIRLANDTRFGLGASIWTKNIKKAREMADEINSGTVLVNKIVRSNPILPFGGINKSGYGRELSEFGIREFVNIKTVCVYPAVNEEGAMEETAE